MQLSTCCYIENEDAYLMLHRVSKKNDVNAGKWIGVGGKFEADETPEECMLREVFEETGIRLCEYRYRGLLTFIFNDRDPEYIFIYTANTPDRTVSDCSEGVLSWIRKEDIPELSLWEGDKRMLSYLLSGRKDPFSLKLTYHNDVLIEEEEQLG